MCLSTLCSSAPGGPVCPGPGRTSPTASGDGGRALAAGGRPGGVAPCTLAAQEALLSPAEAMPLPLL